MKLKSITAQLGLHTCTRCSDQSHEGWEICAFDGSKWYVCEGCMVRILPRLEIVEVVFKGVPILADLDEPYGFIYLENRRL
jgi:hypothetical protein